MNVDLLHVLFGTVLALGDAALLLLASIATITLATLAVLYRPLVLECVDPTFLRSVSRAGTPTHLIFLARRAEPRRRVPCARDLLAVGMMMLPAASARFWSSGRHGDDRRRDLIGIGSGVCGLLLSFHLELPAGPAIILTARAAYIIPLPRPAGRVSLACPAEAHLEA